MSLPPAKRSSLKNDLAQQKVPLPNADGAESIVGKKKLQTLDEGR